MATSTSPLVDLRIGQVFTPLPWAQWLLKKWGVFEAWLAGASVCDPTAGQGVFALALLHLAKENHVPITKDLVSRLTLIEVCKPNLDVFEAVLKRDLGICFPSSRLIVCDVIREPPPLPHDILVGNPPWSNFADLPSAYKESLKPHFLAEGLVANRRQVLLGASRTDIAALVLKVSLGKLLRAGGTGCFFLPTSLFCGDDAHSGFRNYHANKRAFAVDEVFEFTSTRVFEVNTSYCCARFTVDRPQKFPVEYHKEHKEDWTEYRAAPFHHPSDPWRLVQRGTETGETQVVDIGLAHDQQPRQGVNTCGANAAFIFDHRPKELPSEFLYPLVTKHLWKEHTFQPEKWMLVPYDPIIGRPLSWQQIEQHKGLRSYLLSVRDVLDKRKGTLIRAGIEKGFWWSLLGVGPYSFAPYKVLWEAYGATRLEPIVLRAHEGQVWQGNQALHAFIPCWAENDAIRVASALKQPKILELLKQLNGSGKCNWAQPGKMKKILGVAKNQQLSIDV